MFPRHLFALALTLSATLCSHAQEEKKTPSKQDQSEISLGKQGLEDVQKEGKLVKDGPLVERVNRIGKAIGAIAAKEKLPAHYGFDRLSEFDYQFFVIEDKDVNAFSLPGGFIFVNTGLLDFCESDDELAGVLAHEVAHAAHHHMIKLGEDSAKVNRDTILAGIAAMVVSGGGAGNLANILQGVNLYQIGRTNAYVNEAEVDADTTGYAYVRASNYNPVGMLTFMERLNAKQKLQAAADLGILRTHPPTDERAENILTLLDRDHIPVIRSKVSSSDRVETRAVKSGETEMAELYIDDFVIGRVANASADRLAALNKAFDSELEVYEIQTAPSGAIVARGATMLLLTEDDAAANGLPLADLRSKFRVNLKQAAAKLARGRSLAKRTPAK